MVMFPARRSRHVWASAGLPYGSSSSNSSRLGTASNNITGLGYRLTRTPDRLYPWEIGRHLGGGNLGKRIDYLDTVDSTNSVAFRLALTGGRGRHVCGCRRTAGRERQAAEKVAFPLRQEPLPVRRPEAGNPSVSKVYPLTFISSLAVYDTLTAFGVTPRLKWPNDVLVRAAEDLRNPHRTVHRDGQRPLRDHRDRPQHQHGRGGDGCRNQGQGHIPFHGDKKSL